MGAPALLPRCQTLHVSRKSCACFLKASYRFVTTDGNPHRLKSGHKSCAGQSAGAGVATEYGRILRDEQGGAVYIQLAGEDYETMGMDRNVKTMDMDRNAETMDGMDQG